MIYTLTWHKEVWNYTHRTRVTEYFPQLASKYTRYDFLDYQINQTELLQNVGNDAIVTIVVACVMLQVKYMHIMHILDTEKCLYRKTPEL